MTKKIQLSVGVLLRFYYLGKKSTSRFLLLPEIRLVWCGLKSNHSIGLPKIVQSFEIAIGLTWITSWVKIQVWSQESPDISKTLQLLKTFRSHGIFFLGNQRQRLATILLYNILFYWSVYKYIILQLFLWSSFSILLVPSLINEYNKYWPCIHYIIAWK